MSQYNKNGGTSHISVDRARRERNLVCSSKSVEDRSE